MAYIECNQVLSVKKNSIKKTPVLSPRNMTPSFYSEIVKILLKGLRHFLHLPPCFVLADVNSPIIGIRLEIKDRRMNSPRNAW